MMDQPEFCPSDKWVINRGLSQTRRLSDQMQIHSLSEHAFLWISYSLQSSWNLRYIVNCLKEWQVLWLGRDIFSFNITSRILEINIKEQMCRSRLNQSIRAITSVAVPALGSNSDSRFLSRIIPYSVEILWILHEDTHLVTKRSNEAKLESERSRRGRESRVRENSEFPSTQRVEQKVTQRTSLFEWSFVIHSISRKRWDTYLCLSSF
jgi:hypothetical protein